MENRKPIQVSEAIERVMENSLSTEKEICSFHICDQRVLLEPIIAKHPIPSFDKSPYDGFAIRSIDTIHASADNPIKFTIIEQIGAGQVPTQKLAPNEATRIMTGAKIPEGADCVAMFEVCQTFGESGIQYMTIKRQMEAGQNIVVEGSEAKAGELLIEAGTFINPGVKAVLATFGYSEVAVAKKPVVGVFATGTELLDVEQPLEPSKIRNSNGYMVNSQVLRSGAEYKYFGKLEDELESSYETIKKALDEVDILITTGGVSVGDYDLMPAIYEKLGATVLFNKIAMRPGSVTTVAVRDGQLLFGLSGNPSACYVGFELFVKPIIQAALGNKKPFHQRIQAILAEDFPKPNPFSRFVRSYLEFEDGKFVVKLAGMDKSNVVSSLAHTTCLMFLPGGTRGFKIGDQVDVLLIENMAGQSQF